VAPEACVNVVYQQCAHDAAHFGHVCCDTVPAANQLPRPSRHVALQLPRRHYDWLHLHLLEAQLCLERLSRALWPCSRSQTRDAFLTAATAASHALPSCWVAARFHDAKPSAALPALLLQALAAAPGTVSAVHVEGAVLDAALSPSLREMWRQQCMLAMHAATQSLYERGWPQLCMLTWQHVSQACIAWADGLVSRTTHARLHQMRSAVATHLRQVQEHACSTASVPVLLL
jgi:hypothetical protein